MGNLIEIERIPYEEPYIVNLIVKAANNTQCGQLEIYDNAETLTQIAISLEKFPSNISDEIKWELGSEKLEDRNAFYFLLRVFNHMEEGWTSGIHIRFNNNEEIPRKQFSEFCIPCEPAGINRLGKLFKEFAKLQSNKLIWNGIDGEIISCDYKPSLNESKVLHDLSLNPNELAHKHCDFQFFQPESNVSILNEIFSSQTSYENIFYRGNFDLNKKNAINFSYECPTCHNTYFTINLEERLRFKFNELINKHILTKEEIIFNNIAKPSEIFDNLYNMVFGGKPTYSFVKCNICNKKYLIVIGIDEKQNGLYFCQAQGMWMIE